MRKIRFFAVLATIIFILIGIFIGNEEKARAADGDVDIPQISLKRINDGTGVKISINPTMGAEYYYVYMTNRKNIYSKYLYNNGEELELIAIIDKNGTKKRTYTIKGLPKGTYSFRIDAYGYEYKVPYGNTGWSYTNRNRVSSIEKSIKIKAGKKKQTKENKYNFRNVKVGDIIKFGHYEQDDDMNNGKEEIEWIVLSKDKEKIFVMSKYVLDIIPYNNEITPITWEKCSLRKWLNKDFINSAFSKKERSMIRKVKNINIDNPETGTDGGKNTKDKVFLLSFEDMQKKEYGFNKTGEWDIYRRSAPTPYAIAQGYYISPTIGADQMVYYSTDDGRYTCWWWLRTIGYIETNACEVGENGGIDTYGSTVFCKHGVRPALYIYIE